MTTRNLLSSLALLVCGTTVSAQQPARIEVWNIVGRGPTQVRIVDGQATIIGDAPATPMTATTTTSTSNYTPIQSASPTASTASMPAPGGAVDALDEVNAARARRGLPPFARDENLTRGAMGCAQARASWLAAGHTSNDFAYLPAGTPCSATGCAAWSPSWGWGSCCTYEGYSTAGAAWVMGADGRRYMSLFVR